MTALIEVEHPNNGLIRVAIMSQESGEVYYKAERVLFLMGFSDPEKSFRQFCNGSIRLDGLDDSVVVIPASDVRRLINHCAEESGKAFGHWLLVDARREALRQARQLALF